MTKKMLTVLTDDITGAAEIAGVCLRYGRSVVFDLYSDITCPPETDVWIIASDTRSLPEDEACRTVRTIARRLKEWQVQTIFKKIDSALRGHIIPEIEALKEYIAVEKILILPANPRSGRIVRNGIYYIHEMPLDRTSFANDPDFPARTASVCEILSKAGQSTLDHVITPDILTPQDYEQQARQIRPGVLPAGGSAFFEACLRVYFPEANPSFVVEEPLPPERTVLMICGSVHDNSRRFIRNDRRFRKIVIPSEEVADYLYTDKWEQWISCAASIFDQDKQLLIAVENGGGAGATANQVRLLLARITQALLSRCTVDELLIEGGATACACIRAAGLFPLVPVREYARGVVRMKIPGKENLHLTIKPGSYEWSSELFKS
jgi:uncharacterized protein YgbK (DUF1537 family)